MRKSMARDDLYSVTREKVTDEKSDVCPAGLAGSARRADTSIDFNS